MNSLESLALALSAAHITLIGMVVTLGSRDARGSPDLRLLVITAACLGALELSAGPTAPLVWEPIRIGMRSVSVFNLALLWLFSLSLLRDRRRLSPAEYGFLLLLTAGPTLVALHLPLPGKIGQAAAVVAAATPFAMVAHVAWTAATGWRDDLVVGRRRGRPVVVLLLMAAVVISVLSEELPDPVLASIARNAIIGVPGAFALLLWLARLDPGRLRFESRPVSVAGRSGVDPRDRTLHAALIQAMETGRLFQLESLHVEELAARLRTPPHRLRNLINRGLGFRNFSEFVNGYRLAHAKAALTDDKRARETILAIAYEAGFGSLQTFNRTFKAAEGLTPREFRNRALNCTSDTGGLEKSGSYFQN